MTSPQIIEKNSLDSGIVRLFFFCPGRVLSGVARIFVSSASIRTDRPNTKSSIKKSHLFNPPYKAQ
jgi:hypothetical protein